MAEKFTPYDFAEALDSIEAIEVFMAEACDTGDAGHIAAALDIVARSRGMNMLTAKTGISADELYQSLSDIRDPTLETMMAIMRAMGLHPATAS